MTQKQKLIAPGLTAIAAVLALHAIPAVAQEVAPSTSTLSLPAPTPDPAPVASDPLSPDVQADTATAQPEAVAPAAAATTRTTRSAANRPAARASTARTTAAPAPAAAPVPVTDAEPPIPADPAAIAPLPVEPAIAPTPAAEPVASDSMDEIVPIAGAAGVGVLALAGLGLAVRRRRKRKDEEAWADDDGVVDHPATADPEPVMARAEPALAAAAPLAATVTPRREETIQAKPSDHVSAFAWGSQSFTKRPTPDPIPAKGDIPVIEQTTNLPDEFDLSRFGRHVQAAYQGPTATNPSLSLKNRLRRASYFDKIERDTGEPHPLVEKELELQR